MLRAFCVVFVRVCVATKLLLRVFVCFVCNVPCDGVWIAVVSFVFVRVCQPCLCDVLAIYCDGVWFCFLCVYVYVAVCFICGILRVVFWRVFLLRCGV